MNRKHLKELENAMRQNMTNRNVTKFQEAYNVYLEGIGVKDSSIKVDGQYGDKTSGAAAWFRQHNKFLDEEAAFQEVQGNVAEKRLDFYRNFEFTKPSDTSSVKKY